MKVGGGVTSTRRSRRGRRSSPGSSSDVVAVPGPGVRVDDRELDLLLVGAEVDEQLVDGIEDLGRSRVGPVDLVERDDHRQPPGHRLLEHIAGLRQRALSGVHEQQHGVDHEQRALDLTTEVGMAGRVDDVEADVAVLDGGLLREDRDALLALEVHRVHHAVDHGLVRPEGAGLAEHRVDQRGLAVVDVRDDRHVADVVAGTGGHGDGVSHMAVGRGALPC